MNLLKNTKPLLFLFIFLAAFLANIPAQETVKQTVESVQPTGVMPVDKPSEFLNQIKIAPKYSTSGSIITGENPATSLAASSDGLRNPLDGTHSINVVRGQIWNSFFSDPVTGKIYYMPCYGPLFIGCPSNTQAFEYPDLASFVNNTNSRTINLPRSYEGTYHAALGGFLYYAEYFTNTMVKVRASDGALIASVQLPGAGYHNQSNFNWGGYSDICFYVDSGNILYVMWATAGNGQIQVSRLNQNSLTVEQTWTIPRAKRNTGYAFIANGVVYLGYYFASPQINARYILSSDVYDTSYSNLLSLSVSGYTYITQLYWDPSTNQLFEQDSGSNLIYPSAAGNSAPTANAQQVNTNEDSPVNITLSAADPEYNSLTYSIVSSAGHGTLSGTAPNLTYHPNADYNGPDSFTFKVNDGSLDSNIATVTITVNPVNDNPTANNDESTVAEDSGANQIYVLSNDSTLPDAGETLTITAVTQGAGGSVAITDTGASLSYTPNANFFGSDSFTYTVSDGNGGAATATVNVTVTNVNDNPSAGNDEATVAEDSGANQINVLSNDSILPDANETLIVTSVTQGASGSVAINNNGSVTYTPAADFFGNDSFAYTISDGNGGTAVGTVNVTVTAVNDAPTAVGDSFEVNEDTPLNPAAPGVKVNDNDIENDALTAVLVSGPAHAASFSLNADGSFSYTPAANYNGADSFTYKVNDSELDSNTVTVSITVQAVNDAPTAGADAYTVDEDTPLSISAPGVKVNDSDVENSPLTVSLVSGPTHAASFTLNANGSFSYTPAANYYGEDSFTYKVNDGELESAPATVSITVNPVNDQPTIAGSTINRQQAAGVVKSQVAVVGDIEDAAGALLVTVNNSSSATVNGVTVSNLSIDAAGNVRADVAAACGASGAQFTLKVTDSGNLSATAVLNVNVALETTPPVINPIANVTVSLPGSNSANSMPVNFPLPTATDNCSTPTVTTNPVSGSVFPVGTTTVNVRVVDAVGNISLSSFTVTVRYSFSGFFSPVQNLPATNTVTAGQIVDISFSLNGNKGMNVLAPGYPASSPIPCDAELPGSTVQPTTGFGRNAFSYNSTTDRYRYQWYTGFSWAGTCRMFVLKLSDGSEHYARFSFN